jgi:hypothetical protein
MASSRNSQFPHKDRCGADGLAVAGGGVNAIFLMWRRGPAQQRTAVCVMGFQRPALPPLLEIVGRVAPGSVFD